MDILFCLSYIVANFRFCFNTKFCYKIKKLVTPQDKMTLLKLDNLFQSQNRVYAVWGVQNWTKNRKLNGSDGHAKKLDNLLKMAHNVLNVKNFLHLKLIWCIIYNNYNYFQFCMRFKVESQLEIELTAENWGILRRIEKT